LKKVSNQESYRVGTKDFHVVELVFFFVELLVLSREFEIVLTVQESYSRSLDGLSISLRFSAREYATVSLLIFIKLFFLGLYKCRKDCGVVIVLCEFCVGFIVL